MGSVCCCFTVPDVEETAASNDPNQRSSSCFRNFITKFLGRAQETARTSANAPSPSTAVVAINSSCNTIRPGGSVLSNCGQQPQVQQDVAIRRQDKGTSHSRVEPEPVGVAELDRAVPRQPQVQQDVAIRRQDRGTSHSRVEPEPVGVAELDRAVPRQPQVQQDVAIRRQDRGTSHSRVEPEPVGVAELDLAVPRQQQMHRDVAFRRQDKGTSHSRVEPEPVGVAEHEITQKLLTGDKPLNSDCEGESKECHNEFPGKAYSSKMETEFQYFFFSSEDEDVCPTCLEEYTLENPKIPTKCSHHFHLSCIYEWQERSETCPMCGTLMEFEETS